MNRKRNAACGAMTILMLLVVCCTAQAVPILGPHYPPTGGVTFGTSGAPSAGDPGGINFHFSGFNPSAFTELYWGPASATAVEAGLNGFLIPLSFSGFLSSTTARWSGSSPWVDPTTLISYTRPVELRVSISGLGGSPWTTTAGGTVSAAGVGAVVNNSSGLNFTANLQFLGAGTGGLQPLNTIPQRFSGLTRSSFQGGFYDTPVPEPGSLALLGLGLAGLGLVVLRRRK